MPERVRWELHIYWGDDDGGLEIISGESHPATQEQLDAATLVLTGGYVTIRDESLVTLLAKYDRRGAEIERLRARVAELEAASSPATPDRAAEAPGSDDLSEDAYLMVERLQRLIRENRRRAEGGERDA